MKKIRINELARELEVKAHEILDRLPELGVTEKKTHSSSIDEDVAIKLRQYYGQDVPDYVHDPNAVDEPVTDAHEERHEGSSRAEVAAPPAVEPAAPMAPEPEPAPLVAGKSVPRRRKLARSAAMAPIRPPPRSRSAARLIRAAGARGSTAAPKDRPLRRPQQPRPRARAHLHAAAARSRAGIASAAAYPGEPVAAPRPPAPKRRPPPGELRLLPSPRLPLRPRLRPRRPQLRRPRRLPPLKWYSKIWTPRQHMPVSPATTRLCARSVPAQSRGSPQQMRSDRSRAPRGTGRARPHLAQRSARRQPAGRRPRRRDRPRRVRAAVRFTSHVRDNPVRAHRRHLSRNAEACGSRQDPGQPTYRAPTRPGQPMRTPGSSPGSAGARPCGRRPKHPTSRAADGPRSGRTSAASGWRVAAGTVAPCAAYQWCSDARQGTRKAPAGRTPVRDARRRASSSRRQITISEGITVKDLAEKLDVKAKERDDEVDDRRGACWRRSISRSKPRSPSK